MEDMEGGDERKKKLLFSRSHPTPFWQPVDWSPADRHPYTVESPEQWCEEQTERRYTQDNQVHLSREGEISSRHSLH